jgi:GNAT superfamily N-acetyltransferase
VEGRLATDADAADLAAFYCVRLGEEHEVEVEEWINADALLWFEDRSIDPRLVVFYDDDGDLAALAAHRSLDPDNPALGRYIQAVAVSARLHGQGLGPAVLASILQEATAMCPGGTATWLVHPRNHASQSMCQKIGYDDYIHPPEQKPYMEYSVDLDPAQFPPVV